MQIGVRAHLNGIASSSEFCTVEQQRFILELLDGGAKRNFLTAPNVKLGLASDSAGYGFLT